MKMRLQFHSMILERNGHRHMFAGDSEEAGHAAMRESASCFSRMINAGTPCVKVDYAEDGRAFRVLSSQTGPAM